MKVTVIIPNYNGKKFLKPCLDSLEQQTIKNFEVIVVDNGSIDDSVTYIKNYFPLVQVIPLDQNYGFSRAVNEGIKASITPYVILLNNDTVVHQHFVKEMVEAIEKSPKIFSVSSKMLQMHNSDLIDNAGGFYTLIGWDANRGVGRRAADFQKPYNVFSACGGAAIYRRETFQQIGYFDETFFAYLEDVDIGYRAKIHGYKNRFTPKAMVYHVGSGTSGSNHNAFKVRLSARNSIWVNYKNMPILQLAVNFFPLLMGCGVKLLFFTKMGFGKDYREGLKEGFTTLKQCDKTPFKLKHLLNYLKIEIELIMNTAIYMADRAKRGF